MIYPFLSIFERGLGVSTQAISWALALRSASGVLGPFLGSLADRYGRKNSMLLGLALFTMGVGLLVIWPSFPVFVVMLLLTYGAGVIFIPAIQAYLGTPYPTANVQPFSGISELGWSLSFILGVPAVGWMIAQKDWRAPFPWLTGLGVLALITLAIILPRENRPQNKPPGLRKSMGMIIRNSGCVGRHSHQYFHRGFQ